MAGQRGKCRGAVTLLALLTAVPVMASGRIALPPVSQTFPSHAACVAEMERLAAGDARQASPRVTTAGTLREVTLETRGMARRGPETLRYEATIWYHNGVFLRESARFEISHSFERVVRECAGSTLGITGEKGFTLSTFEPMPEQR